MIGNTIYCHPNSLEKLKQKVEVYKNKSNLGIHFIYGIQIIEDPNIPEDQHDYWELPENKFIEYDYKDLDWMIFCGWVKEHRQTVFYNINPKCLRTKLF